MTVRRVSGKDGRLFIGGMYVNYEKFDLKIDDKRAVAYTNGIPNGYVAGECSASGSITLDSANYTYLFEAIGAGADSYQDIEPQDIKWFAMAGVLAKDINAYGCLLSIEDLISAESKGGEKSTHSIKFDVTSPDFVDIDGRPYLSAKDVAALLP